MKPDSIPPQSERTDIFLPHEEVERLHGAPLGPKVVMVALRGGYLVGRSPGSLLWHVYREEAPTS